MAGKAGRAGGSRSLSHFFSFTLMHSAKEEKKIPKNSLENVSSFISIKVDTESRYEAYVRVGGVITPAQFDNRSS